MSPLLLVPPPTPSPSLEPPPSLFPSPCEQNQENAWKARRCLAGGPGPAALVAATPTRRIERSVINRCSAPLRRVFAKDLNKRRSARLPLWFLSRRFLLHDVADTWFLGLSSFALAVTRGRQCSARHRHRRQRRKKKGRIGALLRPLFISLLTRSFSSFSV